MKKQLALAFLVCAALAAVYFWTREPQVRVGIKEVELPRIDTASVTRVAYSGKEKFELKKTGARFILQVRDGDRQMPASSEAMKELFDAVAAMKPGVFVTEQTDKHAQFKVDDKAGLRVTLYAGDKSIWSLIIGDYAEEGGRYVRVPGDNAVYLSRARFWDITRNSMSDFRERKIVGLAEGDIEAVRLEKGAKSEALSPELVKVVASLRAAEFVETPEGKKQAQALLKASGERVIVTPKNKGTQLALLIASDEKTKKAYAQLAGASDVYEISDYIYAQLRGAKF